MRAGSEGNNLLTVLSSSDFSEDACQQFLPLSSSKRDREGLTPRTVVIPVRRALTLVTLQGRRDHPNVTVNTNESDENVFQSQRFQSQQFRQSTLGTKACARDRPVN